MQYVVDNFGEITAKKSLRRILDKVNELRKNPDIGIWDKKFSSDGIKVRHLNIGPNMVFYLIDDRCEVVVIAVMHCKQSSYVINLLRYAIRR